MIKKKNIYISLYVLVPVIYTGISITGIILTYQLFNPKDHHANVLNFFLVIAVTALITLLISLILLRLLLNP